MTLLTFAYLIAGLVLLAGGAEALVRGSSRLATRLGLPPLITGLTVAAFATSAANTAISIQAIVSGSGDIAVGNVIGSNIANILLIVGLCALLAPQSVSRPLVHLHVPVMIATGALAFMLARNGSISQLEGALLLSLLLPYTLFLRAGTAEKTLAVRREIATTQVGEIQPKAGGKATPLLLICLGLGLLALGSDLLVAGAVALARALGLSELIVGLTVIAVGTSLPGLASSVLAVCRGERELAVGNAVGSCTLNLLLALGAGAAASSDGLSISPNALAFDLPVMLGVFAACLPVFFSGYRINRWEGLLLLCYYGAYGLYLVMFSAGLSQTRLLGHAMTWYVLPLTVISLFVIFLRAWRRQR